MNEAEIHAQIKELQDQLKEIHKGEMQAYIVKIQSLDWLKDCDGILQDTGMSAAGLQRFRIILSGKVPKTSYCYLNSIVVAGVAVADSFHNICYVEKSFSVDQPCFETSNVKLLTEFLRNNKFRKLEFENDVLELLLAAQEN